MLVSIPYPTNIDSDDNTSQLRKIAFHLMIMTDIDRITILPAEVRRNIFNSIEDVFTLNNCCLVSRTFAEDAGFIIWKHTIPVLDQLHENARVFRAFYRPKRRGREDKFWRVRVHIIWALRATLIRRLCGIEQVDDLVRCWSRNNQISPSELVWNLGTGRKSRLLATFSEACDAYTILDHGPSEIGLHPDALDEGSSDVLRSLARSTGSPDSEPIDSQMCPLLGFKPYEGGIMCPQVETCDHETNEEESLELQRISDRYFE